MTKKNEECYRCGGIHGSENMKLHGYTICTTCRSKLGLLTDKTIKRHLKSFEKAKAIDPNKLTYEEEIRRRVEYLEKDYISKRIKLFHVLERLDLMIDHD